MGKKIIDEAADPILQDSDMKDRMQFKGSTPPKIRLCDDYCSPEEQEVCPYLDIEPLGSKQGEKDVFDRFANALREKFYKSLKKKGRSEEPWKAYSQRWLMIRLREEIEEYLLASNNVERKGEAVDIGNFAMFLWESNSDVFAGKED